MPVSNNANKQDQSQQFINTARALGADEDEVAFKAKLAAIARQKPAPDAKPTKGAGQKK